MRVRWALGFWGLVLTGAWAAAAQPWDSLMGATGGAFWWRLRLQGLYLSGILSMGMMSLVMLLALRQPWMEKPLGGMDQVYRLHKWTGTMAAVAAVLHWAAKESDSWIKDVWGREGHRARCGTELGHLHARHGQRCGRVGVLRAAAHGRDHAVSAAAAL